MGLTYRLWHRKHARRGLAFDLVETNGQQYRIRELSVAERLSFRDYMTSNDGEPLLALAWLVKTACFEWSGKDAAALAADFSPSAMAAVSNAVLELSDMVADVDLPASDGAAVIDMDTAPGTVADAKKNCA